MFMIPLKKMDKVKTSEVNIYLQFSTTAYNRDKLQFSNAKNSSSNKPFLQTHKMNKIQNKYTH